MSVISDVNVLLTEDAMQSMNAAVDLDKKEAGDVAQAFLEANGLV
jgi:glycine betaine/choline ABC-type transport system substrate-binding protein